MAGVIMPPNASFRNIFIEKVEDVALVLLLPLFFVFTGLRTQIGLLNEPGLWQLCLVVVAVAVIGKLAGSALAARFVGLSWHSSLSIGALMNTRGLMELVALNIGYDLGVQSPEMFAILVLMALITTFMTGPLLDLFSKVFRSNDTSDGRLDKKDKYNILISFGSPYTGKALLQLAHTLTRKAKSNSTVTALHLSLGNELNHYNAVEYERDNFRLLEQEGERLLQDFIPVFKPTDDIDEEIIQAANNDDYDLLLVGVGQSVFEGTLLGRILGFTTKVINPEKLYETITGKDNLFATGYFDERTKNIIRKVDIPTGILIDKGFPLSIERVVVSLHTPSDSFLLLYLQKFIQNSEVLMTLLDMNDVIKTNTELKEAVRAIAHSAPKQLAVIRGAETMGITFGSFDLLLVSLPTWKAWIQTDNGLMKDAPTTLVLKS